MSTYSLRLPMSTIISSILNRRNLDSTVEGVRTRFLVAEEEEDTEPNTEGTMEARESIFLTSSHLKISKGV